MTKNKNEELYQKTPGPLKMISNFVRDFKDYIKEGAPNVTPADYEERIIQCGTCPNLKKDSFRCNLCGCYMEHKAKWKTAVCPDNPPRWKPQIVDKKDEQSKG